LSETSDKAAGCSYLGCRCLCLSYSSLLTS